MRQRVDPKAFELLGEMLDPPPPPPKITRKWAPRLTPAQQTLFASKARYPLCHGEKGSAKTYGCLMKLVRHCYENKNALVLILVRVKSMANKGGAWDKLMAEVLPVWRDGNRDRDGKLLDEGLGLQYSEVKFDSQHNEFVWVQNQFGGWCMIVLVSAPHANQLRDRIRGYEPSMVFTDELTSTDSDQYFQAVAAQIGRRPQVKGQQQYIAACNPEGESHWVYQKWFVNAFNEETGEWDPDFERIYFPIADNAANLQPGYLESLAKIYRDDPTEADRMIRGLWIDRPSGEGVFAGLFNAAIHVRPIMEDGTPDHRHSLMPEPAHPFIITLDPGSVYNVFIFMQWLPIGGKMKWLIFDEFCIFKKRISYPIMVPAVMRRLVWWRAQTKTQLAMVWISDENAFNVFRPGTGSFDVLDMEKVYEANRALYGLPKIKIRPCPKFSGSVKARVRLQQTALAQDEVIVSSRCVHVKKMYEQLKSTPQKENQPFDPDLAMTPQRSDHLHVHDAISYAMLAASTQPSLLQPMREHTQTLITAA